MRIKCKAIAEDTHHQHWPPHTQHRGEMERDRQTASRIEKDRTSIKSHEVIHPLPSRTDNKKKPRVRSKARAEGHAANLQYKSAAAAKPP